MDLGLKNRVALVAAASQGLGFACALELAREGAIVILCSRDEARASEAARRINEQTGARVAGFAADITDEHAVTNLVEVTRRQFGEIEILITNSGGSPSGTFDDLSLEDFRIAYESNAIAAMRLAKLVLPAMRKRRWGRIVNSTSISAKQPIDGLLLSNTVRAAITGWAKTLSNEVAADNITVNNVAPGYTLTERQYEHAEARGKNAGKTKEEMIAGWAAQAPIDRLAQPEEIAAAVVFLASERASYITGVTLQVDGGYIKSLL